MASTRINKDQPLLSVIIVNFNGIYFLSNCLASLRTYLPKSAEVIVVDNASQDSSAEWIEDHHPWVRLIRAGQNLGFTGGNNLGAQASRGKYLLLLNNDTAVQSPLAQMVEMMEADPTLGVLGCSLSYGNGRLQESAGYAHSLCRLILSWLPLKRVFPDCTAFCRTVPASSELYKMPLAQVDWVSGACLMTPLALWQQLGGLDERYFMYVEDVDYCRRVTDAGYRVAYSSCSRVTHYEVAGRSWVGSRAVLNTAASYQVFARKYFTLRERLLLRLLLPVVLAARASAFLILAVGTLDRNYRDKARAFAIAAWRILSGNMERA